jgi:hypothetical protein
MAMAVDNDLNRTFMMNRQKLFLIAGRIDECPYLIIDKNAVAMGILSTPNEANTTFFKIKHDPYPRFVFS